MGKNPSWGVISGQGPWKECSGCCCAAGEFWSGRDASEFSPFIHGLKTPQHFVLLVPADEEVAGSKSPWKPSKAQAEIMKKHAKKPARSPINILYEHPACNLSFRYWKLLKMFKPDMSGQDSMLALWFWTVQRITWKWTRKETRKLRGKLPSMSRLEIKRRQPKQPGCRGTRARTEAESAPYCQEKLQRRGGKSHHSSSSLY